MNSDLTPRLKVVKDKRKFNILIQKLTFLKSVEFVPDQIVPPNICNELSLVSRTPTWTLRRSFANVADTEKWFLSCIEASKLKTRFYLKLSQTGSAPWDEIEAVDTQKFLIELWNALALRSFILVRDDKIALIDFFYQEDFYYANYEKMQAE